MDNLNNERLRARELGAVCMLPVTSDVYYCCFQKETCQLETLPSKSTHLRFYLLLSVEVSQPHL